MNIINSRLWVAMQLVALGLAAVSNASADVMACPADMSFTAYQKLGSCSVGPLVFSSFNSTFNDPQTDDNVMISPVMPNAGKGIVGYGLIFSFSVAPIGGNGTNGLITGNASFGFDVMSTNGSGLNVAYLSLAGVRMGIGATASGGETVGGVNLSWDVSIPPKTTPSQPLPGYPMMATASLSASATKPDGADEAQVFSMTPTFTTPEPTTAALLFIAVLGLASSLGALGLKKVRYRWM